MALSRPFLLLAMAICCSQVLAQYQPKCQSTVMYIINSDGNFNGFSYEFLEMMASTSNFSYIDVSNGEATHYSPASWGFNQVYPSVDNFNWIHQDIPTRYFSANTRVVVLIAGYINYLTSMDSAQALIAAASLLKDVDNVEIFLFDAYGYQQNYDLNQLKLATDIASNPSHDHVLFGQYNSDIWRQQWISSIIGANSFSFATIGDPYVRTMDGSTYSFNGLGEFILYRSNDYEVQVRMAPCDNSNPSSRTCNRAVVIYSYSSGQTMELHYDPVSEYVSVYASGNIIEPTDTLDYAGFYYGWYYDFYVNVEKYDTPIDADTIFLANLQFDNSQTYLQIAFGSKVGLSITGRVDPSMFGNVRGLVGNWDGCSDNDFYSQNQTYTSPSAAPRDIYFNFADTWRVDQAGSYFTHGVNAKYYMPYYDEYAPQWNPAFTGPEASANAPGDCAYFAKVSPFLYSACVDDVSKGNGDIRPVAFVLASFACSEYCDNGGIVTSDFVSEAYCASTCPTENALNFHDTFNTTNPPEVTLTTTAVGATFSATLGGTYTYALTSGFCPDASVTGTVQITCDQPPQVNAGDDRVVTKHAIYSWPYVVLMGSVSDQNNDALEYSWKFISAPQAPNYTAPGSFGPYQPYPGYFPDLYNERSLTPVFQVYYPGDYVLEFAVFDGCFIAKDQVTVHAQCGENCKLHVEAEQIPDKLYQSQGYNVNSWTADWSYSNSFIFDYEFADSVEYHWFIDSNSRGYNFEYPEPSNTDTYVFTISTPEVVVFTNVTVSTSNPPPSVNTDMDSVNTNTIIRNEARSHTTTVITTQSTTTSTTTTYSSIKQELPQCSIQISNAGNTYAYFYVVSDVNATTTRPFTQQPACVGDYTVRVGVRDECQSASDLVNLRLACSEQPQAHLISCTKTIKFDYTTGLFPSVYLDGSDTFDADTNPSYLLYQWQYVTPSGVTKYINPGCTLEPSTNAYIACPTTNFRPLSADGAGNYAITMWVSDGCTYDFESTTVVAQCDPLSVTASAVNVNQDSVAPAFGTSNFTASFTSAHETYVTDNWVLTSAPVGYLSVPNQPAVTLAATNATPSVYLGGSYTYTYSANDGCTTASQAVTFNYVCSSTLTFTLDAAPSTVAYGAGSGFPTSTITLNINETVNTNSARAYWRRQLVGKPTGSGLSTVATAWTNFNGGSNPTFDINADLVGAYTVQYWVWDNCNLVTHNVTVTATCTSLVPSIQGTQSTYTLPSLLNLLVNNVFISSSFENYTIAWSLVDPAGDATPIGSGFGLTTVSFYIPSQSGSYQVNVVASTGSVGCSATASATFTATCNVSLGITAPGSSISSAFTRGKFSRVTVSPSFTGVDTYYDPMRTYLSEFTWKFTAAPVGSVFAPMAITTVDTVNGTTIDSDFVYQPASKTWTRTWERTDTVTTTQVTKYVSLDAYDDSYDSYDGCFAPDVAGSYTLEFSIVDYCGHTVKQTYTVNAGCNAAPTASAGSATTYTFDGTGFADPWEYRSTAIPLNGTASDADGDFLHYRWEIVGAPNNTYVNSPYLTNERSKLASFVPTSAGVYTIRFSATDGCSTTTSNVVITVNCPNTYKVNDPISFTFDGFTPVALQDFTLLANPQCTRDLYWSIVNYNPATAIPPPSATTTTESSKSGSSLISIPAFLIACLALFVNTL